MTLQCSVSHDSLQYRGMKQLTPGHHVKKVSRKVHDAGKEGCDKCNSGIKRLKGKVIIKPSTYRVFTVCETHVRHPVCVILPFH